MSIELQLKTVNTALQTWMDTLGDGGGKAFVVNDMHHFYYMLFNGPKTLLALTMYNGEAIRQVFEGAAILGRVDRQFVTAFSRGRSLEIQRGMTLTDTTFSGPPLYDLVQQGRDIIRGLTFNPYTTEHPVDYIGIQPVPMEPGIIIDALQVSYSIGVQLNENVSTPIQATG